MVFPKRFYALDSFRGLCAVFVVVFHMHLPGSITELDFFRGAHEFVTFFFILSGFVLAHAYGNEERVKLSRFLVSRAFRLFPLHLFMLLVFVLLEFGKLAAKNYGLLFNSAPFTGETAPAELLPNIFLLQSWSQSFNPLSFNYPSWSISVEFYVYIIFAATILFVAKAKWLAWGVLAAAAAFLIYTSSGVLTVRALEGILFFFLGTLSYLCYRALGTVRQLKVWVVTVLEVVALVVIVFVVGKEFAYKNMVLAFAFCGSTILFAFEGGMLSRFLKFGLFKYLGKLSYSIYLIHAAILFCVIAVCMVMGKVVGGEFAPMMGSVRNLDFGSSYFNNAVLFFVLIFIVAISSFTYKYVELGGQALGRKFLAWNIASKGDDFSAGQRS